MAEITNPFFALFEYQNFGIMILGVVIGMIVGVLPGIGAIQAMALMIPLSWRWDITPAFILLFSIYATSKFGGSLTAILFNIPGDAPNAVTLIDGFPMAQNGKAKTAIAASATASTWGGIFSAFSVLIFMPVLYQLILIFGPPEYFMLALFGLSTIAVVSAKSVAKGLLVGGMGVLLSTIGYHPIVGQARYAFGTLFLEDGIDMVTVILGVMAMNEAITLWMERSSIAGEGIPLKGSYREGFMAFVRNFPLVIRSSLIAFVVGIAPGAGTPVAGFIAYASAVKTCKNPETFGKGDVRGVIAADTALHSCMGGDLLPTIALGIPGAAAMALVIGALILHGVYPGPQIIRYKPDLIYLIVYTIVIAHIASVIIALLFTPVLEKITKLRAEIISPIMIVFCLVGSYMGRENWQDMMVTTIFGVLGYYMKKHGYSPVPLVLGVVLGPVAELTLFESLNLSDNGILVFFTRIPSLIIFLCTLAIIFWPKLEKLYKQIKHQTYKENGGDSH